MKFSASVLHLARPVLALEVASVADPSGVDASTFNRARIPAPHWLCYHCLHALVTTLDPRRRSCSIAGPLRKLWAQRRRAAARGEGRQTSDPARPDCCQRAFPAAVPRPQVTAKDPPCKHPPKTLPSAEPMGRACARPSASGRVLPC